jgi:predicted GNAT family N-acyltransferase
MAATLANGRPLGNFTARIGMEVAAPATDDQFARYYDLRWRVLRQPWGEPPGSERDDLEASAEHAVIWAADGTALAAGRLHFNTPAEAQIRYMAVSPTAQGRGLGRRIVEHLEQFARRRGATAIVLNSRDAVAGFYHRLGFESVGAGPTHFGIPHIRMMKRI